MTRLAALERVAAAVKAVVDFIENDEGPEVWDEVPACYRVMRAALAEVERAGEDEDDATLAGMTDAEIDTYLRANGIHPAASYERLRVRVKKETGVDLPPAAPPAEPGGICHVCGGSGVRIVESVNCPRCGGTGREGGA